MSTLKAAAATAEIAADDGMTIGGSILGSTCERQEAPLRASALVIEAEQPICIVSCDVLGLGRDLCDEAAGSISEACEIPFDNILIAATHTHHAPTTMTVHDYERVEEFCRRTVAAAVDAAMQARRKIADAAGKPNECEAELLYASGQECTVGRNSRWLMTDGQITWSGHDPEHAVRPSGRHDPDLPVLVLRRPTGELAGGLFCHATHNIGTREANAPARSPGFFGLAAQELEDEHNAPFLYLPGAFGSSHRPGNVAADEAVTRVVGAVNEALAESRPALVGPVLALRRPFTYRHHRFEEAEAASDVSRWCDRWFDEKTSCAYQSVFAQMRQVMAGRAGQTFETWLQVIRLGEVALVGIPGEMFGTLGLAIRRRSPFRDTVVTGLANDEIGYIPDEKAYQLGGYQTWVGYHCQLEAGAGEEMVEAAVALLEEAWGRPGRDEASMGLLTASDAEALQRFYNGLSTGARGLFRPLGWNATHGDCCRVCQDAVDSKRLDVVLRWGDEIVGWAFLAKWKEDVPDLGIGVAGAWRGKGHGRRLMEHLVDVARHHEKQAIVLMHVKENEAAGALYRSLGFAVTGERAGSDGNEYWEMRLTL